MSSPLLNKNPSFERLRGFLLLRPVRHLIYINFPKFAALLKIVKFIKEVLIAVLFLYSVPVFSQKDSSAFFNKYTLSGNHNLHLTHTSSWMYGSQVYNPAFQKTFLPQWLGNTGLPYLDSKPDFKSELGFKYGFSYQPYLHDFSTAKFLIQDSVTSITNAVFVLGARKEQLLNLTHFQNLNRNTQLSVNIGNIKSEGFYRQQATAINNLAIGLNYVPKNENRLYITSKAFLNKYFITENGGINQANFEELTLVDKRLLSVNIDDSKNINRSRGAEFYPKFLIVKNYTKSLDTLSKKYLLSGSKVFIGGRSSFTQYRSTFQDTDPASFYDSLYFNSNLSFDSLYNLNFSNAVEVQYESWKDNSRIIFFQSGLEDSFIRIHQGYNTISSSGRSIFHRELADNFNNRSAYANLILNISDHILGIESGYFFSGYNVGDRSLKAFARLNSNKSVRVNLLAQYSVIEPAYQTQLFVSNNFRWNNDLKKINRNTLEGTAYFDKINLVVKGNFSLVKNYVFFDISALPSQHESTITYYSGELSKPIRIGKFHLATTLLYQNTSNDEVIRIPDFAVKEGLYYQSKRSKKGFFIQIGFDIFYFQGYYGYAYMPAISQFHLQNGQIVGNYPQVDLFINSKVKDRFRLFVKAEHINYGLINAQYYTVKNYPMPDRWLKFGVNWIFVD